MCCTCQYGMELLVVEWIAFVYRAGQILKQIPQAAIAGSVLLITLLNGRGRRGVRGRSSRAVGVVLAVTAERATKLAPAVVSNLLVDGRTADGTDILRDRRGGLCRGRGLSRSSGAVGIGLTGPAKDSAELTLTVVSNLLVNGSATAGADETVLDRLLRSVLLGRSLLRGCLIRSRTSRCRGCGSCIRDIAFSMRSIPTGRNLLVALGICSLLSGSVALVLLSGSVALILLRSRIVTLLRRCGLAIAVAVVGIPVAVILALAAVKEDEVIGAVALQIAVGISLVGGAFLFFKAVDHTPNKKSLLRMVQKGSPLSDCLFVYNSNFLEVARRIAYCNDMHLFFLFQHTVDNHIVFHKQLPVTSLRIGSCASDCTPFRHLLQAENRFFQCVNHVQRSTWFREIFRNIGINLVNVPIGTVIEFYIILIQNASSVKRTVLLLHPSKHRWRRTLFRLR